MLQNLNTNTRNTELYIIISNSPKVAEMGDRTRAKWAEKWGTVVPLSVGATGSPSNTMSPWAEGEAYLSTNWYHDPRSRLATIDIGRKVVRAVPLSGEELTLCRLGRGLPPYQVAS